MGKLTDMQRAFAENRAAGLGKKDAAIAAGYSPANAAVQASQMETRSDIKAAIRAARKSMKSDGKDVPEEGVNPKWQMPKAKYADPKEFLIDMMNHKHSPLALRADAAKQLLPYMHARIGEKGKKESANDRAKEIAGSKRKFGTKEPPKLTLVGGKK